MVEDVSLHQNPAACATVLTRVVKEGHRGGSRCRWDIGVVEDDVGALAAKLEGDPLDLVSCPCHDPLTHCCRTREADLANGRVRHEPLADQRTLPGNDGEYTLRDAGLQRELTEPDRRQRRELGGLEDHSVAGGQSRRKSPARDKHREVPRHDDANGPERLLEGDIKTTGDRNLLAEQAFW